MRCKTQTFPILLVALFLVVSLVIVGFSVAGSETSEQHEFILGEGTWSVEPEFIERDESVTIEGEVKNVGDERLDDYVDLYVNDMDEYVDSEDLYLDPDESTTVTFSYNKTDVTGTYDVLVELDHSEDQWESQFEVKEETVDHIEIYNNIDSTEDRLTIEAGETIEFGAEAFNNNDDEMEEYENEDFNWYNADDGFFDEFEAGVYEVTAGLDGVESETITVVVEASEAHRLVFVEQPSEDKINAGEVAEYIVEIQDEYGNVQGEGEYTVALTINEEMIPTSTIEDGANRTTIRWRTTREPGEYRIQAIEEDDRLNTTEEHILTVAEEEEDAALAGQWWIFPLSIVVIAVISLVYLSDMDKKLSNLDILSNFGKKRQPTTHEWQRNKELEGTEGEIEPSEEEIVGDST
ncbi:MAG: hypothetical protein ACOCSJ_01880 [Candidatus Natronoplasma sp.]